MSVSFDKESQEKLDEIRRQEEEELITILAKKYGIAHTNLTQTLINTDALALIPKDESHKAEIVAFAMVNKDVSVGIRTPNNELAQKVIQRLEARGYHAIPHMVSEASLKHAWKYYKDVSFATETEEGVLDVSSEGVQELLEKLKSLKATREAIAGVSGMKKMYRVTRILEITIAGALANNVSDIHIEPEEEYVRFRFRLDGVLVDMVHIDHETYKSLLTRLKLLSGVKINITTAAQDGRFSVHVGEREIEIRASVLPGGFGETVVMRLLDPHSIARGLGVLGIRPSLLAILQEEIHKPNGMVLNTGPTGSGKTTTLYAFLQEVLDPGVKILTIEDPIEYKLEGIQQSQVDHKTYTFSQGLRSVLRQDPDVIMVGEIRDREVATTAVHAALTGHLVFSTLHTNNAAGAYPRLIDVGIDPPMVGSAINLVMAQRLLRTLNPEHKKEVPLQGEDREFVERVLDTIHDRSLIPAQVDTVWEPEVSEDDTGYKGRVGVYEAIQTTRDIEDAIRQSLTIREIEDVARKQNFLSLREDAILKVLEGKTSVAEVRRILGDK